VTDLLAVLTAFFLTGGSFFSAMVDFADGRTRRKNDRRHSFTAVARDFRYALLSYKKNFDCAPLSL
jgi:hypothetical protein